uniref:Vespakinin-X n=1 Tax=Vespa xanthoptera TaxID=7448 RepID=BRK_VESXA|nr:RecName: Full=Vespakinin-X; AltName: Full=Bradykinin-related peptide [Vespa simillima xanthoptera]prf//771747A vespakinin X [Vespa orientalis]
ARPPGFSPFRIV